MELLLLKNERRHQMAVIDRWLEYLNRKHVRYSHSVHPAAHTARQTADAERVRPHDFAKTVVYFGSTGFGIAVVPADEFVDLEKVCGVVGLSYIGLASEADLARLFPIASSAPCRPSEMRSICP
jgi:prolyl-tRNA editing enzyme YbaK/EbsC (Cys-tRNA(Pro) deacylase)